MKIIQANVSHVAVIAELAKTIWADAYKDILSQNQLHYMLDKFYNNQALIEQIENKKHIFLLVQENDTFIAFASYQLNCLEPKQHVSLMHKTKVHKIYVLPSQQGSGIGFKLIQEIEKKAKLAKNCALFLNVNRFNKAQYFYKKLGFEVQYQENIEIGNGYLMEDFVMEKKLLY